MAAIMSKSLKASAFSRASARPAKVVRSVVVRAAAERPVWFPGNPPPAHLNGTLAGDYGFDPLNLGQEPETLRWMVQAELVHCRWAMLGVAGILLTSIGAQVGLPFPQWYEAGKVVLERGQISFGTLVATTFLLMGWAETKRWWDLKNPGSQGDGSFFGITDDFKGKENGYPGGKYFDFMGLSRGSEAQYKKYKQHEVINGRLAMTAAAGFAAQYGATGKGPIQNLADHLASPYTTTFTSNGVSVPFLG